MRKAHHTVDHSFWTALHRVNLSMKLLKTCSKVQDSVKRSSILLQNKRLLIHTENRPKMKTPIPGLMNYTSWMGTKPWYCLVIRLMLQLSMLTNISSSTKISRCWLLSYLIVESAFTQVIHDSNRNHWVTISNSTRKMCWFLIV